VRRRLVELPPGSWYDFRTGERLAAGPRVQPAPPGEPPLFVRAGSILTLGNRRESTAEPLTELTVAVYPGETGAWTLIEDDGESPPTGGHTRRDHLSRQAGPELRDGLLGARRGASRPTRASCSELHPSPPRHPADGRPSRLPGRQQRAQLRWPDDGAEHRWRRCSDR
jgi:hypothetical protein